MAALPSRLIKLLVNIEKNDNNKEYKKLLALLFYRVSVFPSQLKAVK